MAFKRVTSLTKHSTPKEIETQRLKLLAKVHPAVVKLMLVGDTNTGKTAVIERFLHGTHRDQLPPTCSVDFACKNTQFQGEDVQLRIYDSPGTTSFAPQEDASWAHYLAGMHAVLVCFEVSRRSSFASVPRWLAQVKRQGSAERAAPTHLKLAATVCILVGTKCDVGRSDAPGTPRRQVSYDEAIDFARRNGLVYVETSAAEPTNVEELFTVGIAEVVGAGEAAKIGGR